jgi:hypothetical protein
MSDLQRVIISPRGFCWIEALSDAGVIGAGCHGVYGRQLNCGNTRRQAFGAQQRHAMKVNFTLHSILF